MTDLGKAGGVDAVRALRWSEAGLELLDQRRLPLEEHRVVLDNVCDVADAIREMVVRGAPAIAIAAAYGCVLAARQCRHRDAADRWACLEEGFARLAAARPTAVNLHWAVARMRRVAGECDGDPAILLREAEALHAEDVAANRRMGQHGAGVLSGAAGVLTHCNTGSLATGGYGTALGVIRSAFRDGSLQVYVSETRPWLQGSRLTAWELQQEGIPATVLADAAAATLMRRGAIDWVVVGADRIAANGDVANKIGTYAHAVAARHHGVGFMVVAPVATIDAETPDGESVRIEERPAEEILTLAGMPVAPPGASAWNPVFDVTPAGLVDVLVTERGVIHRPDRTAIEALLKG